MTFLHILGIILKVLGFTLLGAVGLFLVLLLILLLIPIGADVEYIGGNAKVSAKVCGILIQLLPKKKEDEGKPKKEKKPRKKKEKKPKPEKEGEESRKKKKSRVRRRKRKQNRKKRAKRKNRRKRKSWISRRTRSLRSSARFSTA